MAGAFSGRAAAPVVDLGCGDVAVSEKVLHFGDIHAGIEEQRGSRCPQGVGGYTCSCGR